jgi:hypothetical protein
MTGKTIHDRFEEMGERQVESFLKRGAFSGTEIRHAQTWLELRAQERDNQRAAQEEEARALRLREISASEAAASEAARAANAAEDAAASARKANSLYAASRRQAWYPIIISVIAIMISMMDKIQSLITYISN